MARNFTFNQNDQFRVPVTSLTDGYPYEGGTPHLFWDGNEGDGTLACVVLNDEDDDGFVTISISGCLTVASTAIVQPVAPLAIGNCIYLESDAGNYDTMSNQSGMRFGTVMSIDEDYDDPLVTIRILNPSTT